MLDEGALPHHHETAASHYRSQFYAAIDTVVSTIEDRFNQPDYQIYANLGKTLLKGVLGRDFEDHTVVQENTYSEDFDLPQLRVQLKSLAVSLKDTISSVVTQRMSITICRCLATPNATFLIKFLGRLFPTWEGDFGKNCQMS